MTRAIDGSRGEGGGQVLRASIALSAITGEKVVIENIRKGRKKPGLARQHLSGIEAAAQLCGASLEGAVLGSTRVAFDPGPVQGGEVTVDIGTAGAITLVLQTLCPMIVQAEGPTEVRLTGGTDVAWSPPADYFGAVFLPHLRAMGATAEFAVERRGFYPKGGGRATFMGGPGELRGLEVTRPQGHPTVEVTSIVTENLRKPRVAERQAEAFRKEVPWEVSSTSEYVRSSSTGSVINAVAAFPLPLYGANSLGRRGRPAEDVGREAARELTADLEAGATVDVHMSDQILIYAAMARGPTVLHVREVTGHTATLVDLIGEFLDVEFDIEKAGKTTKMTCEGA